MPTLSTRDNFLKMINCETPEYIPTYNLFWALNGAEYLRDWRNPDGTGIDKFGVEWAQDSGGIVGAALPAPGKFILKDITQWRDVIKTPSEDGFDWEMMGSKAVEARDMTMPYGCTTAPGPGFFETLVSFMGFDEGLMACFEEPEEVKALLNYLCDWSVDLAKKTIQYYKPDFGFLGDDIAHERNPFISLPMFQDIFAPIWRRYYEPWLEAGLAVGNHNCGHFELFLDDLSDMGCTFWDPVQSSNDAIAIKARFGNKMGLCTGGPDTRYWDADTTVEQVREETRAYINALAPNGGFSMMDWGMFLNPPEDAPPIEMTPELQRFMAIGEVFNEMRWDFYK